MIMKIKINLCWVILWSISAYTVPSFSATKEQLIDKVIVSIDDQVIFYTEVESEYAFYATQQKKLKEIPSKLQILENLITNKILLAIALQKGIHIKKEEIEKNLQFRLENIIHQMGTVAKLEQHFGKSIEELKKDLRKNIREQLTIDRMRNVILEDVTIVPQEVKCFFEQIPLSQLPLLPTTVEAYRLVKHPNTVQKNREALEEARLEILQNGKAFTDIAKNISEDTATAANGGEIGFCKMGDLDPDYEKTALSLSPGEVSQVIETQFGLHLIQLIKKTKKRYNTRHILIKHHTHKQTIDDLMQEMHEIYQDILNKKISFNKAVEKYSMDDITTKKQNGLFTNHEGNIAALENLDANIIPIIQNIKSGTVLPPFISTTETGEEAVFIIYVKELTPSQPANLKHNYDYFLQLALAHKKQQVLEDFLEESRKKVIIKFDPAYPVSKTLQ